MHKLRTWIASIIMAVTVLAAVISVVQQPVSAQGAGGGLDALSALNDNQPITTCALDNIGWLICPVLRSAAKAGDYAFTFVAQSFLTVEPTLFNSQGGTIKAWSVARNIANAMFVFAFLVVIYSLITGRGVGNYNIKRMLPRFIVGAILVNISFYICQLMVDISNIAGRVISSVLGDIAKNIGTSGMPIADKIGSDSAPVLTEITSGILSKVDVSWVLLAPISAVVLLVALICSVLIVVLIVRKVLIVALILISPLAFVAYLLPNTEQYFTRWLRLLSQALLLFPVIALLLGAGQIVSAAIIQADDSSYSVENDEYTPSKSGGGAGSRSSATVNLVAAGAAVLPLAGVWYAFKLALSGADRLAVRVRRGQHSRERDKSTERREHAAMQSEKKSKFMQGINRLQRLSAAQDGETVGSTIIGRLSSGRRVRKKVQKSTEQAQFDRKVQDRLVELRQKGGVSPQAHYTKALQQYQESQSLLGESADTGQLNINSFEGIELKAAEAYLLENIGRGVAMDANLTNKIAAAQEKQKSTTTAAASARTTDSAASTNSAPSRTEVVAAASESHDKKAAGIPLAKDDKTKPSRSSASRTSDSLTGGGSSKAEKADGVPQVAAPRMVSGFSTSDIMSAAASAGSAASSAGGGNAVVGNVIMVQQGGSPAAGTAPGHERRSADVVRPQHLTGTELQAKARAARYVMHSQEAQLEAAEDEILGLTKPTAKNVDKEKPSIADDKKLTEEK